MTAPVAVIVPVRDCAAYLGEALASIAAQTVPPAEVVVVDDGSTDGSGDVARAAGFDVLAGGTPEAPLGIGAARNRGIAATSAPFLAFLDADDVMLPPRLEVALATFHADPSLDVVLCHVRVFLSPDKVGTLDGVHHVPEAPMAGSSAIGLLVRRDAFLATGGWSEDLDVHDAFGWFARARELGLRATLLDDVLVRRRVHGDNITLRRRGDVHAQYLRSAREAIRRRSAAG